MEKTFEQDCVITPADVVQIGMEQLKMLQPGHVALIRSLSVPELGDHFIVITGGLVQKEHGIRPQTLTIGAPSAKDLLDLYQPENGVVILALYAPVKRKFLSWHGIMVLGQEVIFGKELISKEVLRIFDKFMMPPTAIDRYEEVGREKLHGRLLNFIRLNQVIKFSLLGYPFKSGNTRDKVLGDLPDFGEEESLKTFARFNRIIKQLYTPGAEFRIVSDGYIFSDIFGVPDDKVAEYAEIVKDMGKESPITFYDITSFYAPGNMPALREKVVSDFGISAEVLEKRILTDPNVNALYRGMIIFMEEELAMRTFPSKSQLTKAAKIMAREAMFRNEAYSALIQHNFTDSIRLSIHHSTNDGTKYSFQLIPGHAVHSPWHSCLVVHKDNTFETMHRKDAIATGYELVNKNNQPFYFVEK